MLNDDKGLSQEQRRTFKKACKEDNHLPNNIFRKLNKEEKTEFWNANKRRKRGIQEKEIQVKLIPTAMVD